MGRRLEIDGCEFKASGLILQAMNQAHCHVDDCVCIIKQDDVVNVIHSLGHLLEDQKVFTANIYQTVIEIKKSSTFMLVLFDRLMAIQRGEDIEDLVFA